MIVSGDAKIKRSFLSAKKEKEQNKHNNPQQKAIQKIKETNQEQEAQEEKAHSFLS